MKLLSRLRGKGQQTKMLFIIAIIAVLEIGVYYYFVYYLNKIVSIDSISIEVKQHSNFQLPKTVEARVKSSKYKRISVIWDKENIDTKLTGNVNLTGRVKGFNKTVNLKVRISEYIKAIERPRKVIIAAEDGNIYKDKLKLPEYLSVVYSTGKTARTKVQWDTSTVDRSTIGTYEIEGQFINDMQCEPKIVCILEVIDKEELLKRIIVQNRFLKKLEVKEALGKIKELPDYILETLLSGNIKIKYIDESITNMPEFQSLRDKEEKNLKVVGVFRYPQILIDYHTAINYLSSSDIDDLSTTTIHEIGHAIDFLLSGGEGKQLGISSESDFLSIWSSEAESLFRPEVTNLPQELNDYYRAYSYEYFAECFALYFQSETSRKILMDNAPNTYDFIAVLFN
ncbi:anthrax toxin lethal factor-related metalloendopeptidase [Clostridium thermarum]|uniref:anthrax toxin lethal factor-related metalloendopeptidase n=1 Tax=Clostridium thermarum TaxID=1716543 RepID=UPI0011228F9F|nr:Ig-like domain-containing protein [Clostridium thermarum]